MKLQGNKNQGNSIWLNNAAIQSCKLQMASVQGSHWNCEVSGTRMPQNRWYTWLCAPTYTIVVLLDDTTRVTPLASVYDNPEGHYFKHDDLICLCLEHYRYTWQLKHGLNTYDVLWSCNIFHLINFQPKNLLNIDYHFAKETASAMILLY